MRTATIIIRDEVNIKIEGLELDARRSLVSADNWRALAASTCMKNS
jgi:hypothetical protein